MVTSAFVHAPPLLARSSFTSSPSWQSLRPPPPPPQVPTCVPARTPARTPARRLTRRVTPSARVRRGFRPNPTIPRTLFKTEGILDIDYKPFDFSKLRDRVVLVVNVASSDPNSEAEYKALVSLLENYHEDGLEIVAFPSNWYGQYERGTHEEIKKHVHETYSNRIHLMSKTDLEWSSVFALGRRYFPGEVVWNFHGKFLFGRHGLPVDRFDLLSTNDYIESRITQFLNASPNEQRPTPPNEADLPDEDDMSVLQQQVQIQVEEEEPEEVEPEPEVDLDFDDAEESD